MDETHPERQATHGNRRLRLRRFGNLIGATGTTFNQYRYIGSDPSVLNREVELDGQANAVVGILPRGPFDRDEAAFFKPLIFRPDQMNRGFHWLNSVARMKPGITLEQAREQMSAIDASLNHVTPAWKKIGALRLSRTTSG